MDSPKLYEKMLGDLSWASVGGLGGFGVLFLLSCFIYTVHKRIYGSDIKGVQKGMTFSRFFGLLCEMKG